MELKRIVSGEQSFLELRRGDSVYIDKTRLLCQLAHDYKYVFLSRPKRFGKSLLCSTLACYFEGRRELFEGLEISGLEATWETHAVIRFDLNGCNSAASLRSRFNNTLKQHEKLYDLHPDPTDEFGDRFAAVLRAAANTTGRGAVVIVDEYDYPMQHTWGNDTEHAACAELMRSMFDILKTATEQLRFVFITGIARFARLSLFSSLNNLHDITFNPDYQAICGITQDELDTQLRDYVRRLADEQDWTLDEAFRQLKEYYDGYHFATPRRGQDAIDIYNPLSLLNALSDRRLGCNWAAMNATELKNFVPDLGNALAEYQDCRVPQNFLESSDICHGSPSLFLYQVGLLTIKDFHNGIYTLRFPNTEVLSAVATMSLDEQWRKPRGGAAEAARVWQARQERKANLKDALCANDPQAAETSLRALLADIPFGNVSKNALKVEERYRALILTIISSLDIYHEREYQVAGGIVDLILYTPRFIYVVELKTKGRGGAREACAQIERGRYLDAFQDLHHTVVGWGLGLDDRGKGLIELRPAHAEPGGGENN